MGRRDQRFQIVIEGLRSQIGESFAPGERLPSKREFAAMHGVGETTVKRVMKVLTSEGYVTVIPNVGSFRTNARGSSPTDAAGEKREALAVGLVSRRSADEWPSHEIYPALLEAARGRGIQVLEIPNPNSYRYTPSRSLIQLARVPWNRFDVALFVEAEDTIQLNDPVLSARKVVAVDHDATGYGIDSVAYANANAGAIAARHLLALGHIRFAVTEEQNDAGFPADPAWTERQQGFEATIKAAGGLLLPQWRLQIPRRGHLQTVDQFINAAVAAWAAAPVAQRPTALFALTSIPLVLDRIIEQLCHHGWRVPRDMSVVTVTSGGKFFGRGEPQLGSLRITSVNFDLATLVRRTFDAAEELANEPRPNGVRPRRAPKLFLAPAMLAPGSSTALPPSL
jgi:DNA-binding LacI/PurR family transcriptional regulator